MEEHLVGEDLVFTVQDNGPGISPRAMQNLFRVGYSTKFNPETGNISRGIGPARCGVHGPRAGRNHSGRQRAGYSPRRDRRHRGLFSGVHPEGGHGEGSSMRIYIVEDDTSVIGILEDIVEGNELGVVCGDSGGEPADLGQILALDPDLILVDLLMPQKDGIQVVRELKEQGCRAKFIMISQVSNKEMVAKAYLAGVDFFINKPINLIEVRQVVLNVRRQLENERDLHTIQSVFAEKAAPVGQRSRLEAQRKRIQTTLSQLGMAGEKGARDIVELCMLLLERGQQVSQVGVGALCAQLSDSPKSMEQRARRAVERGLAPPGPAWGWRTTATRCSPCTPPACSPSRRCGPRWPASRAGDPMARPTSSASWTGCWCWWRRTEPLLHTLSRRQARQKKSKPVEHAAPPRAPQAYLS